MYRDRQRHAARHGRGARGRGARVARPAAPGSGGRRPCLQPPRDAVAGRGAGEGRRGAQRAQHARVPGGPCVRPMDGGGRAHRRHALGGSRVGRTSNFCGGSLNFGRDMPTKESVRTRSPEVKNRGPSRNVGHIRIAGCAPALGNYP